MPGSGQTGREFSLADREYILLSPDQIIDTLKIQILMNLEDRGLGPISKDEFVHRLEKLGYSKSSIDFILSRYRFYTKFAPPFSGLVSSRLAPQPIILFGQTGQGKSGLVAQLQRQLQKELLAPFRTVIIRLPNVDVSSISGVPFPKRVSPENPASPSTLEWIKEKTFPHSLNTFYIGTYGLLFLDEFNRGSKHVLDATMAILDGHYFLPTWTPILAGNLGEEENTFVINPDSAFLRRAIIFYVKTDAKSWLNWASRNDIHPLVVSYIKENPHSLNQGTIQMHDDLEVPINPAKWGVVSDFLWGAFRTEEYEAKEAGRPVDYKKALESVSYDILGYLGSVEGSKFLSFVKNTIERGDISLDVDFYDSLRSGGRINSKVLVSLTKDEDRFINFWYPILPDLNKVMEVLLEAYHWLPEQEWYWWLSSQVENWRKYEQEILDKIEKKLKSTKKKRSKDIEMGGVPTSIEGQSSSPDDSLSAKTVISQIEKFFTTGNINYKDERNKDTLNSMKKTIKKFNSSWWLEEKRRGGGGLVYV